MMAMNHPPGAVLQTSDLLAKEFLTEWLTAAAKLS